MSAYEAELARLAGDLVAYGVDEGLLEPEDALFSYNRVLAAVGLTGPASRFGDVPVTRGECALPEGFDLEAWIRQLGSAALASRGEEAAPSAHDRAETALMALLMPRPSEVNRRFQALRLGHGDAVSASQAATDYLYRLSVASRYVRRAAIERNVSWTGESAYGPLEITINLSKPEKDPEAIAQAAATPSGERYPACALCRSNEGYEGRSAADPHGAQDPRQNLRIVEVDLGGETWGLQYSPYAYFEEHCIAMSGPHRPMHVDRENLGRLLDFVDAFPHYFIGSNADLPVVGGSILSHDHFQGGRHVFPMMRAAERETFELFGGAVQGAILAWPLSVVRLRSHDRRALLDAATAALDLWRGWDDPALGLVAVTEDGVPHQTVTPVARKLCGQGGASVYELYLALRSNIASEKHPMGVFHPHEERHHIKRENIGLIEVMGLAILPPRLKDELAAVRDDLLAGRPLEDDPLAAPHAAWARGLFASVDATALSGEAIDGSLREGVTAVFADALADCGVFKDDEAGRAGFRRFVLALGNEMKTREGALPDVRLEHRSL